VNAPAAVALTLLLGYACGSLPWGLWLGLAFRGIDVRTVGSGNLGATNVYRSLGRGIGIATLLLDIAKGMAPVLLAARASMAASFPGGSAWCAIAAGAAAVAGHVWTVFAGFRGGKGVATGGGVVLALAPLAGLCALGAFVLTLVTTRFVSVGSMTAAVAFPVAVALLSPRGVGDPVFALGVLLAILLIVRHRDNIGRLRRGEERKFSLRPGGTT
jgi:glycerol-3-phosphate acyltransferase PlsY